MTHEMLEQRIEQRVQVIAQLALDLRARVDQRDRPTSELLEQIGFLRRDLRDLLAAPAAPPEPQDTYRWGEPMKPYAVLGIGVEAWVDLEAAEREAASRGTRSSVSLKADTLSLVMRVLRAIRLRHFRDESVAVPAAPGWQDIPGLNPMELRQLLAVTQMTCNAFRGSEHGNARPHTTGESVRCINCDDPQWKHWLRRAALAAEAVRECAWLPIATAPKDASKILTWDAKYGVVVTRWLFDSAATPCWWATGGGHRVEPIFWMPLPPSPPGAAPQES